MGLPFQRRRSSGFAFNPRQLFSAGEQGAWYDPSDFSTLFQDSAGTTPVTAVEQPVGVVLDKSGRNNHASQSIAAKRPVLSARYNLLLATETLATQNVTTVAADYTLAFSGAGSITLSGTKTGTYTAGTHSLTGVTAGTLTLTVSGSVTQADLRPANDGIGLPAYQRVGSATDYDTVGFPLYLKFDGVDDALAISDNSLFRNIEGVVIFAAYRSSDAIAAYRCVLCANTTIAVQTRTAMMAGRSGGRRLDGATYSDVQNPAYVANASYVDSAVFGYADNSLTLRSNAVQTAGPVWPSGAGNTSDTDSNGIAIGAQQGAPATVYHLTGRIYGLIARVASTNNAQIANTERYLNRIAKIY